jgi:hypothetical protein
MCDREPVRPCQIACDEEDLVLEKLERQYMFVCFKLPGRASASHFLHNEWLMEAEFNVRA